MRELKLKIYGHSIGQNAQHLIFRTKYNLKFFQNPILRDACETYLREAAQMHGMNFQAIKVLPDHVHMFVELPPTLSVSNATQLLKGHVSRRFFKRFTLWKHIVGEGHEKAHLWSRWRFSRSVGNVNANVIEDYILNSKHNQICAYRDSQTTLV